MATNIVAINRGDTHDIIINIDDDGNLLSNEIYELQGDDAVYFGIMDPHQPFEDALVKKKYVTEEKYLEHPSKYSGFMDDNGNIDIQITPEDTLDLLPGRYYYSIKLHVYHYEEDTNELIDKVVTIINKTLFIIYD